MNKTLRQWFIFIVLVILVCAIYPFQPEKTVSILKISKNYLQEMLGILPAVLILLGLLDVWIPKKIVERTLGENSGILGTGIAFLIGTAAAGPLYVAFPIAASLLKKGARVFNIAIFLCSWAAIKIPMIMFETEFLGWQFTVLRLLLTIPSAILIGLIMEKIIGFKEA